MSVGLGDELSSSQLNICVYIANRPPMEPYQSLDHQLPLQYGEIASIAQNTGNHWRKVFNVYAKLMFAFLQQAKQQPLAIPCLGAHLARLEFCHTWQNYRDQSLLQRNSHTQLLFSPPEHASLNTLHIVMAKGYGQALGYVYDPPYLINDEHGDFACYQDERIILCPYFDYRQLSNIKIDALVNIMMSLLKADL